MSQVVFEDRDRQPMASPAPESSVPGLALPVVPMPAAHQARLKPLEGKPAGTLLVHEIYRSLQGESTFAGLPCVFIRLTACHLRCVYCDTPHAFAQGEILDLNQIVARTLRLGDALVEITGGEPLLQPEVYPLMTNLADAGKTVLLETSGAIDIGAVDPRVRRDPRHQEPRARGKARPTFGPTSTGSSRVTRSRWSYATELISTGRLRSSGSGGYTNAVRFSSRGVRAGQSR